MPVLIVFGLIVGIGIFGAKSNQRGVAGLVLIGLIATVWQLTS